MRLNETFLELLGQKRELFSEFEQITDRMMTDSTDAIDLIVDCVEKREQIKGRIDAVDKRLAELAGQSGEGKLLFRASKNLCDFSELDGEQQDVFRAGQEIFSIITRIQDAEMQIAKNMETMMDGLRDRIKQNKKNTKFTGYIDNMGLKASKGVLYDKKR